MWRKRRNCWIWTWRVHLVPKKTNGNHPLSKQHQGPLASSSQAGVSSLLQQRTPTQW